MKLGAFSVSLAVTDINKSKVFYEHLGFEAIGGDIEQGWLIMRNDSSTIGLFQGMFEKNLLTYNPGWNQDCSEQSEFTDIRDIEKHLNEKGIDVIQPVTAGDSENGSDNNTGPGNMTIADPDGNLILIDQHV